MPLRASAPGPGRGGGADLADRLRERQAEIEEAVLTRAFAISNPDTVADPRYLIGLREAVSAAVGYGIAGIGQEGACSEPIPDDLFAQARKAARGRVGLDTVLRRYLAGYTLLGDFIAQEADAEGFAAGELQRVARAQAARFDRVVTAITAVYRSEADEGVRSARRHRHQCAQQLLAGELADTAALGYELDCWHTGLVATGSSAEDAIRALGSTIDCRMLILPHDSDSVWAWFGSGNPIEAGEIEDLVALHWPAGVTLAIGEPGRGIDGWRLTHRQASAALPVALRSAQLATRYAEVAVISSILQDDLLARSLERIFLDPLAADRDGGRTLRETLLAYFAAERNVSSTAAAMKVSRKTITRRLRTIERRIGRSMSACGLELEAALRLSAIDRRLHSVAYRDSEDRRTAQIGPPIPPSV
jgi:hypothetical protein